MALARSFRPIQGLSEATVRGGENSFWIGAGGQDAHRVVHVSAPANAGPADERRCGMEKNDALSAERFEQLFRDAGAGEVSGEAVDKLVEVVGAYAIYISKYAYQIARHSGRDRIDAVDVVLASMNAGMAKMGGSGVE
jgi:histone H3/H4